MFVKEVISLTRNELRSEWRQKASVGGILLYVIATVCICKFIFEDIIDVATWNALFWIIMLFASVHAVAKSFSQESRGKLFYLYTIASPEGMILSKIICNTVMQLFLSGICLIVYLLLMGNLVEDMLLFAIAVLSGSLCFASAFTLTSAVASQASGHTNLIAILSFPVILPILILLLHLSHNAIEGIPRVDSYQLIISLAMLELAMIALSWILFPYLWRN